MVKLQNAKQGGIFSSLLALGMQHQVKSALHCVWEAVDTTVFTGEIVIVHFRLTLVISV